MTPTTTLTEHQRKAGRARWKGKSDAEKLEHSRMMDAKVERPRYSLTCNLCAQPFTSIREFRGHECKIVQNNT